MGTGMTWAWDPIRLFRSLRRDVLRSTTVGLFAPAVIRGGGLLGRRVRLSVRSTRAATEIRRKAWDRQETEAWWRRGFDKHVLPKIGDKPVAAVTLADVRDIVVPRWKGRNSTGYTLRQNIEYVLDTAVVEKYRLDNPARALKRLLPKVRRVPNHRPSLPYTEVRQAMADWQVLPINPAVKLAVLFIVLTGARLTEATDATWSEIDRSKRIWQVPGRRMKMRRGHDVPLSWQALEVLGAAAKLEPRDDFIFALRRSNRVARPPSQRTVSDALRRLGRVDSDGRRIVVHGFRSTFRVWAMECVPGSAEVAEIALAHEESDTTKKAYARSELDEAAGGLDAAVGRLRAAGRFGRRPVSSCAPSLSVPSRVAVLLAPVHHVCNFHAIRSHKNFP